MKKTAYILLSAAALLLSCKENKETIEFENRQKVDTESLRESHNLEDLTKLASYYNQKNNLKKEEEVTLEIIELHKKAGRAKDLNREKRNLEVIRESMIKTQQGTPTKFDGCTTE